MTATLLAPLLAVVWGVMVCLPAAADQNDPRLDGLFATLQGVKDPFQAVRTERQIWEIWFENDDNAVRILMQEGQQALTRQDYAAALGKYDQVVAIAPDFAEGWNRRATVYYLMSRYEDSLADIAKTLSLEPRHFGALSGRGLVYIQLEDEARALKSFEEALAVHPKMAGPKANAEFLRKRLHDQEI